MDLKYCKGIMEYKSTGAIHTEPEMDVYLERIQSLRRIKIANMNDAVDSGNKELRKRLLDEVLRLDDEERCIKKFRSPPPHTRKVILYIKNFKGIDVSDMTEQYIKLWNVGDCYIEYQSIEEDILLHPLKPKP